VQESPAPEGDYFRVPRILNSDEEWISEQLITDLDAI
jgi:hypothetical protein